MILPSMRFHPMLIPALSLTVAASSEHVLEIEFFSGLGWYFLLSRQKATRGDAGDRTALRSACRSLRLTFCCKARKFCRCHCSMTSGGGESTVHSRRVMAASQYCITTLVTGRWSSAVSETVQ